MATPSDNATVRENGRTLAAVQRLMRGESLDTLSRELNAPAYRLSEWRDRVLIAAEGALKERERYERDDEVARLKAKVGEITMGPSARKPVQWTGFSEGRVALFEDRQAGGWPPFGRAELRNRSGTADQTLQWSV